MTKNKKNKLNPITRPTLKQTLNIPCLVAAGGLVCNRHHHILLIFKRGKWDMPKGNVKRGHDRVTSALREVHEETGLDIDRLSIEGKLVSTWHTSVRRKSRFLKKTHWYLMQYDGGDDDTDPEIDEGIISCRWVHISDLPDYRDLFTPRVNYVIDFWQKNLAYVTRK